MSHPSRKIPIKPHCPNCGRVYKDKRRSIEVCGFCKKRDPNKKHDRPAAPHINLGGD